MMPKKELKNRIKSDFAAKLKDFVQMLKEQVSTDDGQWKIKGFIDTLKNIYTLDSDTKIISKILELHLMPLLIDFADSIGYNLVYAEHQNYYPDLSFINRKDENIKFAVDIKTTFRKPGKPNLVSGFTLGSHGTYFRNRESSKNIQYPYNSYLAHYCLGIIYTRSEDVVDGKIQEGTKDNLNPTKQLNDKQAYCAVSIDRLDTIISVIQDFTFFVNEKWQIASDKHGSGNTANIGSIKKIDDIINGRDVFAELGEAWFDEYWMNYGTLTRIVDGKADVVKNIKDFIEFKSGNMPKYNKRKKKETPKK